MRVNIVVIAQESRSTSLFFAVVQYVFNLSTGAVVTQLDAHALHVCIPKEQNGEHSTVHGLQFMCGLDGYRQAHGSA